MAMEKQNNMGSTKTHIHQFDKSQVVELKQENTTEYPTPTTAAHTSSKSEKGLLFFTFPFGVFEKRRTERTKQENWRKSRNELAKMRFSQLLSYEAG